MKKIILISIVLGLSFSSKAQQLSFNSQYMMNQYLLNPAVAGIYDYMPIATSFRQQWAGFNDAPKTQMFSAHSAIGETMGVGGIIYNDVTGPLRDIGFQGSYAYHLKLNETSNLSFGLALMLNQYYLDGSTFLLNDVVDNTLNGAKLKSFNPDASFGVYYYGENYFAGLSVPQLFQYKFKFGDNISSLNKQVRHYFVSGGYRFDIGSDFKIEPSTLLKYVPGTPFQFDLNSKLYYKDNLWVGLSYRYLESMVMMFGIERDKFVVGYSYDYSLSNIKNYSSGTHEIYLEYKLDLGQLKNTRFDQ